MIPRSSLDISTVHTVGLLYYTGWPKKVSHYQMIKNRIKSY